MSAGARSELELGFQRRVRVRIAQLIEEMSAGLVERDVPVRLALLAAIAGEHVILVGPPGTAKSELARRIAWAFRDARYFERLMTRFSVPEELFGPLSLKALERDQYTRLTDGYLPTASVAFLDEVFKANSAILNALLGVLNERVFDNGTERLELPLISLIGASNEIPTSDELLALYDRFLVRCRLEPVSAEGFGALLGATTRASAAGVHAHLSVKLVSRIRTEAARVRLSPGVRHALHTLRDWLAGKGIYVSDRRWLKITHLLRVAAYTEGRMLVLWPDCWLIQHCLWSRPEQLEVVRAWFDSQLVELVRDEPRRYARLVTSVEGYVASPAAAKAHKKDACGRPLYRTEDGSYSPVRIGRRTLTNAAGEPLYVRPGETSHGDRDRGLTAEQIFVEHFAGDLDGFDDYISDPEHQLHEPVEREPVLYVLAGETTSRREQLVELASDLAGFVDVLGDHAEGLAAPPLWLPANTSRSIEVEMRQSIAQLVETLTRLHQASEALARAL